MGPSFGGSQAELGCIAADGVGKLGAIADQHQGCLLLSRLRRHEAHRRPAHRFAKCLGVRRIVLAALDLGLDQLRCDQFHRMPKCLQQPRQMMTGTTGLDRDYCRRKLLEERHHLLAPKLLAQNRHLRRVHPVKLKDMLRRINPNSANLFHGRSPLYEINNDLILARSMPSGAVHTNTFWTLPAQTRNQLCPKHD
jgi:hypothetical protein